MNKFKVGDRVRIRKGTQYEGQCSVGGKIVGVNELFGNYSVNFDNGYQNSYYDGDLEMVPDDKTLAKYKKDVDEFIGVGA